MLREGLFVAVDVFEDIEADDGGNTVRRERAVAQVELERGTSGSFGASLRSGPAR